MIKYRTSIIYECVRCKNRYEFDFDPSPNVVIPYCSHVYFYFHKNISPPPPNYILSAEHPMVVSIVWILTGICKKED